MLRSKPILVFLIIMLLLSGLPGCGQARQVMDNAGVVVRLQDDYGRTVEIRGVPQRIVSLSPAHTEILFALGLGSRVVGVTDYCNYPSEAQKKTKIGGYMDPNLEKIVALHPDMVVADSLNQQVVEDLEKSDIEVLALRPRDIEAVLRCIMKIGKATGTEDKAKSVVADIRNEINDAVRKTASISPTDRPRVYYEVWNEPLIAAGPGTVIDDLIKLAGGTNVAGDAAKDYPEYSLEKLVEKDPQIMIHSYGHGNEASGDDKIIDRYGWENMSCVRNNKIYRVDADIVTRPGPRIGQALHELVRIIHPEMYAVEEKGDN